MNDRVSGAKTVERRRLADHAGVDPDALHFLGPDRRVNPLGFLALVARKLGADRHVAGDLAVLVDGSGARQHPVEVTVLAAVLHGARPRLAGLQRVPEILECLRRHVGMAHDVVRLIDQFVLGETRGIHKLLIEVGQLALEVGLRNDERVFVEMVFVVGDGQIGAHGGSLPLTERC